MDFTRLSPSKGSQSSSYFKLMDNVPSKSPKQNEHHKQISFSNNQKSPRNKQLNLESDFYYFDSMI